MLEEIAERLLRVIKLDKAVYPEIARDSEGTGAALGISTVVGFLGFLRFGNPVVNTIAFLAGVFVWAWLAWKVSEADGRSTSYLGVLRIVGYSSAPLLLALIPGVGLLAGLAYLITIQVRAGNALKLSATADPGRTPSSHVPPKPATDAGVRTEILLSESLPPTDEEVAWGKAEYVYSEAIRCWSEGTDRFDPAIQHYAEIRAEVGHPIAGVVMTDRGDVVSPAQILATRVVPAGNAMWFTGALAPSTLGYPEAADIGTLDGSTMMYSVERQDLGLNLLGFPPDYLHYTEALGESFITPLTSPSAEAVAPSPDGSLIALLDHVSGPDFVLRVLRTADSRLELGFTLTATGGESLRFSPDGKWLLIDGWVGPKRNRVQLVHIASKRGLTLPIDDVSSLDWFTAAGPLTLLGSRYVNDSRRSELFTFDLESGGYETLTQVVIHEGTIYNSINELRPHPEKPKALALTHISQPAEHLLKRGGLAKTLTMVDLETFTLEPLAASFLPERFEAQRSQRSPEWTLPVSSRPASEATLHGSIEAALEPLPAWSEGPYTDWTLRLSERALDTIQLCMMAQTGEAGRAATAEVLSIYRRALLDVAQYGGAAYQEKKEAITNFTFNYGMRALKVEYGNPSGKPAGIDLNINADLEISRIEQAIRESRFDEVPEGASTWRAPD